MTLLSFVSSRVPVGPPSKAPRLGGLSSMAWVVKEVSNAPDRKMRRMICVVFLRFACLRERFRRSLCVANRLARGGEGAGCRWRLGEAKSQNDGFPSKRADPPSSKSLMLKSENETLRPRLGGHTHFHRYCLPVSGYVSSSSCDALCERPKKRKKTLAWSRKKNRWAGGWKERRESRS